MNRDSHKKGFARLIMDLAKSDMDHSFQEQLSRKSGVALELASLLQLARQRETKTESEPLTEPIPPGRKEASGGST